MADDLKEPDSTSEDDAVAREQAYVFKQLLKSMDDIKHGRVISSEEFEAEVDKWFAEWEAEDRQKGSDGKTA